MKITDFIFGVEGRYITYYPELRHICGNSTATIFLCLFLGWFGSQKDRDGWIYKIQKEIEEEAGLTRTEQETARNTLKYKGLMAEKKMGIPQKLYYKIDPDAVKRTWDVFAALPPINP